MTIILQILEAVSFAAISILVAFGGSKSGWRVRAIIYGWGALILWALFWGVIMPMCLKGVLDPKALAAAFPEGTILPGVLFGGWFWTGLIVELTVLRQRTKHGRKPTQE